MIVVLIERDTGNIYNAYKNVERVDENVIYSPYGQLCGIRRSRFKLYALPDNEEWRTEADYRIYEPYDEDNPEAGGDYHGLNETAIAWIQEQIDNNNYEEV